MKKNKKIISLILTSFMILSIVVSSLVPTISSYADEVISFTSLYNLSVDNIILGDDLDFAAPSRNFIQNKSDSRYDIVVAIISGGINVTYAPIMSLIPDVETYPNYILTFVNGYYDFLQLPEDSFIGITTSGTPYLYAPKGFYNEHNRILSFQYNTDGSYHAYYDYDYQTYYNSSIDTGNETYGIVAQITTSDVFPYLTNIPFYNTNSNIPTDLSNVDFSNQLNPSVDGYSKVDNHEGLRDGSGIWLDNVNCNEGTVYVVVNSDNTQTSANGYKIRYYAECWYTIELPSNIIAGSAAKEMQTLLRGYGYNASAGSKTTVHGVYYWNDYPYQEIGLSEISANGGIWQESLSATNIYLNDNGKRISDIAGTIVSGSNWTQNAVAGLATLPTHILTGSVSAGGMGLSINNQKLASMASNTDYTVTDIKYNFYYKLYKDNDELGFIEQPYSLVSSSGNTGRGDTVENLIGSEEEYFEAGTRGMEEGKYNTDFAASNDIRVSNGGSGGSSSSDNNSANSTTGGSANIGDGAIVINNNPTFNNNSTASADSSSSGFGGFLSTLITLIANGKTSSVDTISSISGTTGYTNLVNTYLSTVPSSLWNVIIVTMTAVLGITIIGFIVGLLFKIFF